MINEMDIILTDEKEIILVIPDAIADGDLTLKIMNNRVFLEANGTDFVAVNDVDSRFINSLAEREEVPLIEFIDKDGKEIEEFKITHYAKIRDCR